jgi:hypothetical protein
MGTQFNPRSVHVGFMVDKETLGHVFTQYFDFPANSESTKFSISLIYHLGLFQYVIRDLITNGFCLNPP